MLHSGDLVKIELILVVEQETPPLYLWKAPNRLIERFIPFFLNHAFIKALRHTQRPSVKGFVPYLVKLPVPLVPLEKYTLSLHDALPISEERRVGKECNIQQRSDLLAGIFFAHRVAEDALFDVVADHGRGQFHAPEGGKAAVHILDGLVQIQPYLRDISVPGQGKPGGAGRNAAFGFRFHGSFKKVVRGRRPGAEIRMFWERYPV